MLISELMTEIFLEAIVPQAKGSPRGPHCWIWARGNSQSATYLVSTGLGDSFYLILSQCHVILLIAFPCREAHLPRRPKAAAQVSRGGPGGVLAIPSGYAHRRGSPLSP